MDAAPRRSFLAIYEDGRTARIFSAVWYDARRFATGASVTLETGTEPFQVSHEVELAWEGHDAGAPRKQLLARARPMACSWSEWAPVTEMMSAWSTPAPLPFPWSPPPG